MLEDVKIIELFFARTEQAIAELAAKYGSTCKRIANNILKCEPDAEECVNDTYLAAWNAIPPERPDPLRTYIFRITRNIAIRVIIPCYKHNLAFFFQSVNKTINFL